MKVIENNKFGAKTIKQLVMSADEPPSSIVKAMYEQSLDALVKMLNASGVIESPIGAFKQALIKKHRSKIDKIIERERAALMKSRRDVSQRSCLTLTGEEYLKHLDGIALSYKKRIRSALKRSDKIAAVNALRDDLTKMIHTPYNADQATRHLATKRFMAIDAAITKWLLLNKSVTSDQASKNLPIA